MVLKIKKYFFTSLFLFALSAGIFALEVPALSGRVNDYANIINQTTEASISSYLESLEDSTGIQMVVLTVPSLKGEDISSFSVKTAEKWGIGRKGKDNGALLVVALQEHDVRIEVGYGLEHKLTDAKCGLIIRNVIIPEFKKGDYSTGILKGIKNMGGIATDNAELVNRSVTENVDSEDDVFGELFMIIIIIIFIIIISSSRRRYRRGFFFFPGPRYYGPSSHHHSSTGPTFRSSGSFGGSSFHGGGGHFGGGGASGHW